jgi:hypothetical protein
MAKTKELKEEKQVEDLSTSLLSGALKEFKEEHYNATKAVEWEVSTGSLLLDVSTGKVRPSLWRLCGNNNSGKTPQMLEIVRNILKDVPNSKALWVMAEGRLSEENKTRCGLKFVTDPNEWEIGTVFVLKTNIFELVIKIIKDLVKNNDAGIRFAFVIDSIDGLILRDDAAKEITENNKVAGVPGLSKKMLQSLSLGMFQYGHWMGLISQVTSEIKLDPYAKTTNRGGSFSGGNSLLHGSDVIIEYNPPYGGDFILDGKGKFNDGKSKPIGQNVTVVLAKSIKETTRKVKITYPIKYGRKPSGIWVEREVGDLILGFGRATLAGAGWITVSPDFIKELEDDGFEFPEKIQGLDNLYKVLQDNEKLTNYLFDKFSKLIS